MSDGKDLYERIFEHSLDAMLVFNGPVVVDCNRAALDMLRCSNKDEIKRLHPAQISPEFQPDGRSSMEAAQENIDITNKNGSHRFRWVHRRMDRTHFHADVTCLKVQWDGMDCTLVTWRDISEQVRKEAVTQKRLNNVTIDLQSREESLSKAKNEIKDAHQNLELFRTAFDTTDADILITDADGFIIYANRSYRARSGYEQNEILGVKARELQHSPLNTKPYREMIQVVSQGQSWSGVLQNQNKNGDTYWVRTRVSPILDDAGAITHYVSVESDISELVHEKEKAEQASRSKTAFLSNMSHELRTPLNAINGFAELLQKTIGYISDEKIQKSAKMQVQTIIMSGSHLLNMIDDILNLSQLESGKLSLTVQPVYLADVMTEVMTLARALPAKYGVDVEVVVETEHLDQYLRGDPTRFRQVFLNLISNAIKYNRDGGKVEVSIDRSQNNMVQVSIRDTGKGIPSDAYDRIFTPFDRLGEEGSGIEGTGVGLALTKKLVELLNGEIGFNSIENEGSEFWVRLPLAQANLRQALASDHPKVQHIDPVFRYNADVQAAKIVLLVEDNPYYIQVFENFFLNNPNVVLISAIDSKSAVTIAKIYPPDVVIIDSGVAGLSAADTCDQMASLTGGNGPALAVLSATPAEEKDCLACGRGCPMILRKPIDFDQLSDFLISVFDAPSESDGQQDQELHSINR